MKQKSNIEARSACNTASSLHGGVRVHRDRARRVINGPHELLGDELTHVGAVRLYVTVLRGELACTAYTVVEVLYTPVLED